MDLDGRGSQVEESFVIANTSLFILFGFLKVSSLKINSKRQIMKEGS